MEEIIFENEIAYKTKYDGYYVTKSGKVITTKVKGGQGRINIFQPREHCYKVDKDGYLEVCLSFIEKNRHIRKYYRVHRLAYETLMGDIPQELTIDHIDANPQNNSIENLQILTRENNTRKALKNKKSPKRFMYQLYKNNIYVYVSIIQKQYLCLCINYTKTIFMLEHLIEKNWEKILD